MRDDVCRRMLFERSLVRSAPCVLMQICMNMSTRSSKSGPGNFMMTLGAGFLLLQLVMFLRKPLQLLLSLRLSLSAFEACYKVAHPCQYFIPSCMLEWQFWKIQHVPSYSLPLSFEDDTGLGCGLIFVALVIYDEWELPTEAKIIPQAEVFSVTSGA